MIREKGRTDCPALLVAGLLAPGLELRPGGSDCAPDLAFASWPIRADSWICCLQLPCHPCKNGTNNASFCCTRVANPFSHLQLSKTPQTSNLSKICPGNFFWCSSQEDWNSSKLSEFENGSFRTNSNKFLTNSSPPAWNPPKTIAGTNFGQIWGSGRV